jgi:uncharacterized protein YndB with AHSA1/START domain
MRLAHRVRTSASPDEVWQLLGDPRRWPEFTPFLRRVHGAPDRVRTGQTLLSVARFTSLRIPVDVVEAVPQQRLELFLHTAPGVWQRVTYELAPAVRGGTHVRVSLVVEGLFARGAAVPLWLANSLTARVLAARAEREASATRRRRGAA